MSCRRCAKDGSGHRLVLDVYEASTDAVTGGVAPPRSLQRVERRRRGVVAIDAGHGGEDPGASGPNKLREKNVVLQIANRLTRQFATSPAFTPVMIRTGDYYITHKGRRDLARKNHADLFISLHADAFKHPSATGASVSQL